MNDDTSDSDGERLLERALVVDNLDDEFDLNIPPTSGSEYLRRVRQEANGCPKVVVADIDRNAFLNQQTVKISEPSGLLPVPVAYKAPMAWQRLQVAQFAATRQNLIRFKAMVKKGKIQVPVPRLPQAKDAENWCRFCFGQLKLKMETDRVEANPAQSQSGDLGPENGSEGTPPFVHVIAHMNQSQVENVLEYHTNWLEATGFSSNQGRWFYALLANLQKPLTPEMCSWLRRLARLCSNIRASIESCEDPKLNELNLIICLVSRYFDQRDLADT